MEHLQIELYRCWCPECADILSRERTTGFLDKQLLSRFSDKIPVVLPGWLENPVEDWTLVDRIVEHVAQLQ
jgi:hypothetical protein